MERRCVNPLAMIIHVNGSLSAGYEAYVKKAERSAMDYGFHMAITKWDDTVSKEMEVMVKEKGINSFKFFMAYKGSLMINDELLLEGFKKCKSLGALAMVYAENGDVVFEGQKRMIELGITGPEGHACTFKAKIEYEEKIEVQMRALNEAQKQTLEKLRVQQEAFQWFMSDSGSTSGAGYPPS